MTRPDGYCVDGVTVTHSDPAVPLGEAEQEEDPMTAPLDLAEEIEPSTDPDAYCGDKSHRHVRVDLTEAEARMVAAALRLAEAYLADGLPGPEWQARVHAAAESYRAARGEGSPWTR